LHPQLGKQLWPVRLSARTPGFHPGKKMANHKSALKRIRNSETKRLRNKYQHKTTRNAIKKLREADKSEAEKLLPNVIAMVDKLAKNNIIHSNKAGNLKSKLTKHVAAL